MILYGIAFLIVLALGIGSGYLIWGRKQGKPVLGQLISGLSLQQKFFLAFALIAAGFISDALKKIDGPYKFSLVLAALLLLFIGFFFVPRVQERVTVTTRRKRDDLPLGGSR